MTSHFGFLIIDKPSGLTSHDCVKSIRKIFKTKKVGHGGTLDPAVTGVLPIAIGNATRLLPYLQQEKEYRAIIQLGENRDTDDLEGEILSKQAWPDLKPEILDICLDQFRGSIQQQPPRFSSIHIQGERAYKRARRGELFTMPTREITISKLVLINWVQEIGQLEICVHCSSGTYIRSLARDLGLHLKCGGYLYNLRRTKSQGFNEKQAIPFPSVHSHLPPIKASIISPLVALDHLINIKINNQETLKKWRKGQQIILPNGSEEKLNDEKIRSLKLSQECKFAVIIDNEDSIIGIAEFIGPEIVQPKVVFNADG